MLLQGGGSARVAVADPSLFSGRVAWLTPVRSTVKAASQMVARPCPRKAGSGYFALAQRNYICWVPGQPSS